MSTLIVALELVAKGRQQIGAMLRRLQHLVSRLQGSLVPSHGSVYFYCKVQHWAQEMAHGTVNGLGGGGGGGPSASLKDYVMYTCAVVMTVRYMASAFCLNSNIAQAYFEWDIVMEAVYRKGKFDKFAFILSSFLFIFAISIHDHRNFRMDRLVIEKQARLVVRTCEQYWRFYPQARIDFSNSANMVKVAWRLIVESISLAKHGGDRLKGVTILSNGRRLDGRMNAFLMTHVMRIELINLGLFQLQLFMLVSTVVSYVLFSVRTRPEYSAWAHALIGFDRLVTMGIGTQCFQNQFFGVYLLMVIIHYYGLQYRTIDEHFHQLSRRRPIVGAGAEPLMHHLVELERRHTEMSTFIARYNRKVVSREIAVFTIFNIPFNIYLVSRLIFGHTPQGLVLFITTLQLICGTVTVVPILRLNSLIHSTAHYVPLIQEKIQIPGAARDKFRLLTLYEQLEPMVKSQLGFTAGPLGLITYNQLFKFVIFYLVYALFSCSLVQKSRIESTGQ